MGLAVLLTAIVMPLNARSTCPSDAEPLAEIVSVQGTLTLNSKPASVNDVICPGNITLITQANSRAAIRIIATGIKIRLDQNTELHMGASSSPLVKTDTGRKSLVELVRGAIHAFTRAPNKLDVRTPYVTAGVEGTEFLVEAYEAEKEIYVHVFEGKVRMLYAKNGKHSDLEIAANEAGYAKDTQAPKKLLKAKIKSRDQVDWALYYPPLSGNAEIEKASKLIAAGRVDEAAKLLDKGTDSQQKLALQTIIKVAQGKAAEVTSDSALVERHKRSSLTRLALSYAYQATLQLDLALSTLEQSTEKDALIWARIAELRLVQGDRKGSAEAAKQANIGFDIKACAEQIPDKLPDYIAHSLSVRGYSQLAQLKVKDAIPTFECAIRFASENPLPRFGLGLAKIKLSQLHEGRHDIEIAAMLDPTNALIRSYLGKAFYEEARTMPWSLLPSSDPQEKDLAELQFNIAKQEDPNDPTPWYYNAIKLQTENRPVEALASLQQAIENNDNRAVYRSEFLLDEDLAARSASLGRVYRDLGFEQLGLLSGWKSVNEQPGDHSGHRLLADTYSSLPRHQIARTNELYQSQLLQPLNSTPVQPQLAETNLFILNNAGPSDLSFNEFNPLFARNGVAIQGSGVVGGNNTFGNDMVVAGLFDRFSYSLGQFHFETDGFRENNDFNQDLINAFVQFRVGPDTSILAEARTSNVKRGDNQLLFNPDIFTASLRQEEQANSARLGIRHDFNQGSRLLASFIYHDTEIDTDVLPLFSSNVQVESYQAEFQFHYQALSWHINAGASYRRNEQIESSVLTIPVPFPPFVLQNVLTEEKQTDFTSAYIYANLNFFEPLSITIGGSYDNLDGQSVKHDRFNPKLGLIWEPWSGTTIRATALRTLQGLIVSKQNTQPRLEPTQVAGFNQFFFGPEGEKVWRYGVAIDQRLSTKLYSGLEYSKRDIKTPFVRVVIAGPPIVDEVNIDEQLGRAYLYWTPNSNFALNIAYQYEKVDNNGEFFAERFEHIETQRVPLELNYFHASGLNLKLKGTYIDQEGLFSDPFAGPPGVLVTSMDQDKFWTMDAAITYRLPQRYGLLSLKVNNLLDEDFRFQDTDPENPGIFPERYVLFNLNLNY
jgi:tetratricopeptide (TPR) repeat protein